MSNTKRICVIGAGAAGFGCLAAGVRSIFVLDILLALCAIGKVRAPLRLAMGLVSIRWILDGLADRFREFWPERSFAAGLALLARALLPASRAGDLLLRRAGRRLPHLALLVQTGTQVLHK